MGVDADSSSLNINLSRMQSPRPETPEPNSRQGRRNEGAQLLNDEGSISTAVCIICGFLFCLIYCRTDDLYFLNVIV